LSFSDLEKTFDPTVGVSIDGVFLAFSTGALFDLDDIESIEVLRGPQGTLYGRNTIGGTINIRRTKPTGENGLKLRASYASYDRFVGNAIGNISLVEDTLAMKIYYDRKSGGSFTTNVRTGERDGGSDIHTVGASFLYTPTENFEALLSLDYQDDNSQYPPILNLTQPGELFCDLFGAVEPSACRAGSFDIAEKDGFRSSFAAIPFRIPFKNRTASLEMNLDVSGGTLTSVTGYRRITESLEEENTGTLAIDLGAGPVPLVAAFRPQTSWQFSQEVRYATNSDGPLNFVVGGYFLRSSYDIFPDQNPLGTGDGQIFILGGGVQSFFAGQDTTVFALFGEGSYSLTDKLRLTLGGRLSSERKEFYLDSRNPATNVPLFPRIDVNETWTDPTWRAILDYQFDAQIFGYLSYARGLRSGGFNGRATGPDSVGPYDPETVDSFEAGLRFQTAD
ncbi:MAG: TonB-dependent receptor, partial [Sandaracinobacteroides sp.]